MSVDGLFGVSSPRVTLMVLFLLGQILSPAAKEHLEAPRNLTVVSEDFKLFLRWQPAENYPPEVFYTVKWWSLFASHWTTTHCVNISATSCDITCTNPRLSNSFRVQLEALDGTGRSSAKVRSEPIDYNHLVEIAPPILQVTEAEKVLVVNSTFSIPSCVKDLSQDLSYDLEFWEEGRKPMKHNDLLVKVYNINKTLFSGGNYCIRAQAHLPFRKKLSNFSDPVCGLLHKGEESWRQIFYLLLLLLLIFPAGFVFFYLSWYKNTTAKFKMPQVLDFSSYKDPKRFLEYEEIKIYTLICERVSEIRRRPDLPVNFQAAAEDDDDDDDEDDYSGSPIPYTEHRFPKNLFQVMNFQGGGTDQDSPSDSDSSLSHGDICFPNVTVCETLIPAESIFDQHVNNRTPVPGSSSSNESLDLPFGCPTTRGWENLNREIDIGVPLSSLRQQLDLSLPTEKQFVAETDFPECTHIPLLLLQCHKNSSGIIPEEHNEEDTVFECVSSGCGTLPKVSSLEAVESCTSGGNGNVEEDRIPRPTFHGYQPRRHISYISRVGLASSSKVLKGTIESHQTNL